MKILEKSKVFSCSPKIYPSQFSFNLQANSSKQESAFDTLFAIEIDMCIFKAVSKKAHDNTDFGFMLELFLKHSAKCMPTQVSYVCGMECVELYNFAKYLFIKMFPAKKDSYVDTQIAFLF